MNYSALKLRLEFGFVLFMGAEAKFLKMVLVVLALIGSQI